MCDLVSIIIPVYNVEIYLRKCIDSVLKNTYKHIEIILVDDGSLDSSSSICDEYQKKYQNVKVIHKTNGGLSSARNSGLEIAEGKYILFIDSDDYISEDFIQDLVNTMIKSDVEVVQSNFEKINEGGKSLYIPNIIPQVYSSKEQILDAFFIDHNIHVTAWGKLYKKEIFNKIKFMEGKNNEDNIFIADLFEQIDSYACIDNAGYKYLQRTNSIINSKFSEKKLDALFATNYIKHKCMQNWENYISYSVVLVCKSCIYLYYDYLKSKTKNKRIKKLLLDEYKQNFKSLNLNQIRISNIDKLRFRLFKISPAMAYKINNVFSKSNI